MEVISTEQTPSGVFAGGGGLLEFEKPLQRIELDIRELEREHRDTGRDLADEILQQRSRFKDTIKRLYGNLTPWETVLVARHPKRPLTPDYIQMIARDYCELHGDRTFGDDPAIMTGFARIGSHRVMLIGHNKGKDVKERVRCNFGCAHPEGYRKALLKMKLAAKYKLPVVCLIDTQGAYPGIGSEERGISFAIAVNLMEMARLPVPIVCVVIGEGGSGGALAIGIGDRVAMLEHSFYSVISPEGCAAILWKTAERRKHAAEALKLTAPELKKLGLIDDIITEPLGGAHRDAQASAAALESYIVSSLDDLSRLHRSALVARRQEKIRNMGRFYESASEHPAHEAPVGAAAPRRMTSRSQRIAFQTEPEPISG